MGLFDFFKSKPRSKQDVTKPFTENQELVLVAMNMLLGDKSLNEVRDFLKEKGLEDQHIEVIMKKASGMNEKFFKQAPTVDTGDIKSMYISNEASESKSLPTSINERYAQQQKASNEGEVEIVDVTDRAHGDNYGGLLGFETLQTDKAEVLINQLVDISLSKLPIYENPIFKVCEADFTNMGGDSTSVRIRVLHVIRGGQNSNTVISSFPFVQTDKFIPFETKKIMQWSDNAKLEADIEGGGRDTFGLGFYASDYAKNRHKYRATKKLDIKISAVAFVLEISSITDINGTKVDPDFCTYIPNKDFPSKSYFDFVGKLLDYKKVALTIELKGYILSVKLINHDTIDDFFTIDIFINELNMKIKDLEKGMKLTGLLWFQGEIA